eukprot:scaffold237477_cov31-Tisochrysis_lutea.AAC.3
MCDVPQFVHNGQWTLSPQQGDMGRIVRRGGSGGAYDDRRGAARAAYDPIVMTIEGEGTRRLPYVN